MNFIERLSSRKFIAMVVGVIVGIALAFDIDGEAIQTIAGTVTTVITLITYIITEGMIDSASARKEVVIELTDESEDVTDKE